MFDGVVCMKGQHTDPVSLQAIKTENFSGFREQMLRPSRRRTGRSKAIGEIHFQLQLVKAQSPLHLVEGCKIEWRLSKSLMASGMPSIVSS
jgi:hypothetical protein